jgi:type I restriction enzyme S subunit
MAKIEKEILIGDMLEQMLIPSDEQPYVVPENWCWVTVKSINKYRARNINPSDKGNTVFELYSVPSYDENYPEIVSGSEIGSSKQHVQKNDVLICKINPRINRVWHVTDYEKGLLLASSEWIVVRNDFINSRYLMHYFRSQIFREYLLSNVSGVGGSLMRAQPKYVETYPIPLPPITEQYRIVEHIEVLISRIANANELIHECIDKLEARKMAIFDRAFTGKLTEQWRKSHRTINNIFNEVQDFYKGNKKVLKLIQECQTASTIIEEIDDAIWIKCNIGSVAEVTNGSTPSRANNQYWNGSIPWVSSGEVNNSHIWDTKEKITEEGYKNTSVKFLPIGTVLIAMIGEGKTRGQSAILEIEATTNQNIAAIQIPHGLVSSEFLWYWLQYQYKKNREKGAGSGPQALNCQRVRELEFIIPPFEEQIEVVRILNNVISIDNQSRDLLCMKEDLDSLKKSILTKAFHGELSTTDLSEPSSIELLKSIISTEKQ